MLLFADYETYWDSAYTLRKMTPAEYILDPRFQAHGMSAQHGEQGKPYWVPGEKLQAYFNRLKYWQSRGQKFTMITYNALFDMCITAWRYDYVPDLMIDVLGMVRASYGPALRRASLGHIAQYLNLGESKGDWVMKVQGLSTEQILAVPGLMEEGMAYAAKDVRLMVGAYRHIMPSFPLREIKIMDLVLRCAVQPQFIFDKPLLEQHLIDVRAAKAGLLDACGLQYDENGKCPELMSTPKFKALLEAQGVVVEDKFSATGRTVPALAKTDAFMQNLLEDNDATVAALAAARLGHKSTIEETRTERFIAIAALPSAPGYMAGSAPMPLRYGAAHTHRLGGDWKLNVQNMPAGRNGKSNNIRKSVTVRKGEKVVTADEAQIEARLSACLAKEKTLLREFTDKLDPYGQLGAFIFNLTPPAKGDKTWRKTLHPIEGFIGKTGILGLGYGAGPDKFHTMVNAMARTSIPVELLAAFSFDINLARKSVTAYRTRYHRMPYTWSLLQHNGLDALTGRGPSYTLPPVIIKRGVIWGPNGQRIIYPDLKQDPVDNEWSYQNGNNRDKIYGAKILENITQWLSRIIVMEAGLRLDRYGLRFALQSHDELAFAVPERDVPAAKVLIKQEMERRPLWMLELPLEADVGEGDNYGEAKG